MPYRFLILRGTTWITAIFAQTQEIEKPSRGGAVLAFLSTAALVLNMISSFRSKEMESLRQQVASNKQRIDDTETSRAKSDHRILELERQRDSLIGSNDKLLHDNLIRVEENLKLAHELAILKAHDMGVSRGFLLPSSPGAASAPEGGTTTS